MIFLHRYTETNECSSIPGSVIHYIFVVLYLRIGLKCRYTQRNANKCIRKSHLGTHNTYECKYSESTRAICETRDLEYFGVCRVIQVVAYPACEK